MNFTFGIITSSGQDDRINKIVETIIMQNIPNYEIIVVGNYKNTDVNVIPFNENVKKAWITKKKNIITDNAKYDNIVYMHDYIYFDENWYKGWLKFGDNFKVAMNVILNKDKSRFRDWTLWTNNDAKWECIPNNSTLNAKLKNGRQYLLPYDVTNLSKYMYISGSYWVAKKDVMKEFPLDEKLTWGQGEDVVWSKQVRSKYKFSMNVNSTVHLMKQKDRAFNEINKETLKLI